VLCVAVLAASCGGSVFLQEHRVCVLLSGVHFLQCSEYWATCINVCVIHMHVICTHFVYLVLFQCVQVFSFLVCSYPPDGVSTLT
jgi:hypothetical protein